MGTYSVRTILLSLAIGSVVVAGACSSGDGKETSGGVIPPGGSSTTIVTQTAQGPVKLATSDLATGLDTPWAMAFDRDGKLWFTERPGRVRRLGDAPETVPGVVETGESGLMGIAFDRIGRRYLWYTTATDNRLVRYDAPG